MTYPVEEFHLKFRRQFTFGLVIFTIFLSYFVVALLIQPDPIDPVSPLAFLAMLGAGIYFTFPFIFTRRVVIDDSGFIFKPVNVRYPTGPIKQIKKIYKKNEQIVAVQLITQGAPSIWLPMMIVGGPDLVKLNLANMDGEKFVRSLEKRVSFDCQ